MVGLDPDWSLIVGQLSDLSTRPGGLRGQLGQTGHCSSNQGACEIRQGPAPREGWAIRAQTDGGIPHLNC